jgi:leader peptidase (prepilin peptidase) / N-methyltransferase
LLHYPYLNAFIECVLFVAGLVFGSFLNVCITRIPRDESIVRPPSHCRECGKPIRWFDNIPVVSFLLLRGRCRDCGTGISLRYPAVELLTAAVFAACYAFYGPTLLTLKFCVLGFLLVGLIFMDAETGLLPHEFTYTGIVLGLAFAWIAPFDSTATWFLLLLFHHHIDNVRALSLLDATIGAAFGAAFFYLTWAMYYLARKRHGLGFGDIALIALSGAFLGLKLNLLVIICGPILTVLYILVLLACEPFRRSRQRRAPSADVDHPALETNAHPEHALQTVSVREAVSPAHPGADLAIQSENEIDGDVAAQRSPADDEASEETPFLQRELPFGVFLGACALMLIFFGEVVWTWYLGRF